MTLLLPLRILAAMRDVPGWLADEEAELLIAGAALACRDGKAATLVEVGSYQGRSTVVLAAVAAALAPGARVYAIDPHEGTVGAEGAAISHGGGTFEAFTANLDRAGVAPWVEPIRALSYETAWERPIDLLFVDGLHDRMNVERDFRHFEPFLLPGAVVLFHDYADYYPGVRDFVDQLTGAEGWTTLAAAASMRMIARAPLPER